MAKNPNFFVSFRPLLLFLPCILCIFFFFFFVLLLALILLLLLLLLNNQIRNFLGAFTLFQGKELCFSYVVKSFWYALILLRHTWIKTERKGSYKKIFYHIRQNRVLSLERKLEMASNPQFFFVSFHPLLLFILCILCIFFFFFFVLLLPLLLLLLLLLLPLQCINGYIRVKLG